MSDYYNLIKDNQDKTKCKFTTSGDHAFVLYELWRDRHTFGFATLLKRVVLDKRYKRCIACGIVDL